MVNNIASCGQADGGKPFGYTAIVAGNQFCYHVNKATLESGP